MSKSIMGLSKAKDIQLFQALNEAGADVDFCLSIIGADLKSRKRLVSFVNAGMPDFIDAKQMIGTPAAVEIVTLSVDYSRTLAQMINVGCYDWINSEILNDLSVNGEGTRQFEARLFYFDRLVSFEKATEAIQRAGMEPGKIEHLLAFGQKCPNEQRMFSIFGLGSPMGEDFDSSSMAEGLWRSVPVLKGSNWRRELTRESSLGEWAPPRNHFLGVRELPSGTPKS